MIRKLLLILCIAFAVFAFGYPCMIFPYTNYTYTQKIGDKEVNLTLKFSFNGKVKMSGSLGDVGFAEQENYYYKISFKDQQVLIAASKDFDAPLKMDIKNIYSIGSIGMNATNNVAKWTSLGVGVVTLLLVITMPTKRRR